MKLPAKTSAGVLVAILVTGVAVLGSSVAFFPASIEIIDLERGEKVFDDNCGRCHSVRSTQASYGPSLGNIGSRAGSRIPGLSAEEYLFESVVRPDAYRHEGASGEMPRKLYQHLGREDVINVVGFLAAQGGVVDYRRLVACRDRFPVEHKATQIRLELASLESGRALFSGELGCVKCHASDSAPGRNLAAPPLVGIAAHLRAYVERQIMEPSAQITAGYREHMVNVGGRIVTGRVLHEDTTSIGLLARSDSSGNLQRETFDKSELETFDDGQYLIPSKVSRMPSYGEQLTQQKLDSLVDFLLTWF